MIPYQLGSKSFLLIPLDYSINVQASILRSYDTSEYCPAYQAIAL